MNLTKEIIGFSKKEIGYKILISVFMRVTVLILPIFWANVITNITNTDFDLAYKNVLYCLIITVLYWISEYVNQIIFYKLYNKIYYNLTTKAINGMSKNSLFSLSRFSLSEYLNILNNDIDVISSYYTNLIARIIRVIEFVVIYYYFLKVNFYMFLIVSIISIVGIVSFIMLRKKTFNNNLERKELLDKKTSYNHEFFIGIRDIKAFNLFEKISSRLFTGTTDYLKKNAKYNVSFNGDKFFIVGLIEVIKYILMFYGVYLVGTGQLEIGVLVIINNYYAKIIDNFGIVSTLNVEKCNLNVSANRYNKIFEYADYNEDAEIKNRNFNGKIEFHNILYGYKTKPTLKDFSLVIEANSFTTIVGKDNSGYNGIYELLLKMNRQHYGTITIDDIDIKNIQNSAYYNNVALVNHNPFFFNLSIKDNLAIVNKNEDEIIEVCENLGIHKIIKGLPNGYDTIIDDNISSELKIMLAISRVLLKKTKIIILADVLFELEKKDFDVIIKTLKNMSKNHTIIILGRELDSCVLSDKVVVMDKNEIKEIGTHDELVKNKGFYYNNFYNYGNKKES